jgi:predicted dehydrogenase
MRRKLTDHLRIGVVGAGAMGARHARAVVSHPDAELVAVVDHSQARARQLVAMTLGAAPTPAALTWDAIERCDAVVVAASTSSHAELAVPLLLRGIPVLVEKPLGLDQHSCQRIISASVTTGVPVMCGFVERFNAAWQVGRTMIDAEPGSIHATRQSPPVPRAGSGVVTDLMIHDLDLVVSLRGDRSTAHSIITRAVRLGSESAEVELQLPRSCRASFSASRDAVEARRAVRIAWEGGWIEIDLLNEIVSSGRSNGRSTRSVECRTEHSALSRQLTHFIGLVRGDHDAAAELDSIAVPHALAYEVEHALASGAGRAELAAGS